MSQQREYAVELKKQAVERALSGERIAEIAAELGIGRKRIYAWKDRYARLGDAGLQQQCGRPRKLAGALPSEPGSGRGELLAARKRIAELERKVGQQELELDFFGEALRRIGKGGKPSAR
jgi:transposase